MKWTDELIVQTNISASETYSESDYDENLREQRVGNVVKDYGIWDRPKVGSISVDDLLNDGIPSFRDSLINKLIEKREMNLLYHCRYQLVDIITMIDSANKSEDLSLELLKVLVGDIKKVFGDKL